VIHPNQDPEFRDPIFWLDEERGKNYYSHWEQLHAWMLFQWPWCPQWVSMTNVSKWWCLSQTSCHNIKWWQDGGHGQKHDEKMCWMASTVVKKSGQVVCGRHFWPITMVMCQMVMCGRLALPWGDGVIGFQF
jgi:hypothetical protein